MSRRRWTHRRLGIGGDGPSEPAMAGEDRLLDEVGARGRHGLATRPGADALHTLLSDYVAAIDAQIPRVDRRGYRAGLPSVEAGGAAARVMTTAWLRSRRTLIPVAAGASVLAIVAGVATLPHTSTPATPAPTTVVQPHVVAVVESQSLLHHASVLLTAAHVATRASDRRVDVREVRADLTHVAALLPFAPRASRLALRAQVDMLRRATLPPPSGRAAAPGRAGAGAWPGAARGAGTGPGSRVGAGWRPGGFGAFGPAGPSGFGSSAG